MPRSPVRVPVPVLVLVLVLACSPASPAATPPAPPLPPRAFFLALERDFQPYRGWRKLELPEARAQGVTHPAGRQIAFINASPPAGSRRFPVGTMIVKDVENPGSGHHQLFAMVKRGAGFNARGAKGWEWFELKERDDGSVGIVWRGLGAPNGEGYGGDPVGTCNTCHETSAPNDYVQSRALALR